MNQVISEGKHLTKTKIIINSKNVNHPFTTNGSELCFNGIIIATLRRFEMRLGVTGVDYEVTRFTSTAVTVTPNYIEYLGDQIMISVIKQKDEEQETINKLKSMTLEDKIIDEIITKIKDKDLNRKQLLSILDFVDDL